MQKNTKQYEDFYNVVAEFFPDSESKKLEKDTIKNFFKNFEKQSLEYSRSYSIFDGNYLDVALIYRYISDKIVGYIRNKYNVDYSKFNKTIALSYKDEILENNDFFLLPTELYCNLFKTLKNNIKSNKNNNKLVINLQKIINKLAEQIVISNEATNLKKGLISAKFLLKIRLLYFANLSYLPIYINSNNSSEFNLKICDLLNIVNYQNFTDIEQIKTFVKYTIRSETCTNNITQIEDIFELHLLLNNILQRGNNQQNFNSMYVSYNLRFPTDNYTIYELLNTFRIKNVPLPKHIYIYNRSGRHICRFMFFSFLLSLVVENYPLEKFYFIINNHNFEHLNSNLKFDLIISSFNKSSRNNILSDDNSKLENINYIYQHLSDNGKAICNFKIGENTNQKFRHSKIESQLFPNYILEKNHIECIIENIDSDLNKRFSSSQKYIHTFLIDKSRAQNDNDKIVLIKRILGNHNLRDKDLDSFEVDVKQFCSIFNYYYNDSIYREQGDVFMLNKIFFHQLKDENFSYYFDSYEDIYNTNSKRKKSKFVSQVETDISDNIPDQEFFPNCEFENFDDEFYGYEDCDYNQDYGRDD